MGTCVSFYLMYCMIAYDVKAEIHSKHILYALNFPTALGLIVSVFHFIPTVALFFISSVKRIQLLGLAVLASFVFSKIYFEEHMISVWCFFAGMLSIFIFWIILKLGKAVPQR